MTPTDDRRPVRILRRARRMIGARRLDDPGMAILRAAEVEDQTDQPGRADPYNRALLCLDSVLDRRPDLQDLPVARALILLRLAQREAERRQWHDGPSPSYLPPSQDWRTRP